MSDLPSAPVVAPEALVLASRESLHAQMRYFSIPADRAMSSQSRRWLGRKKILSTPPGVSTEATNPEIDCTKPHTVHLGLTGLVGGS